MLARLFKLDLQGCEALLPGATCRRNFARNIDGRYRTGVLAGSQRTDWGARGCAQ